MAKYVVTTANNAPTITAMNSYSGTLLAYTDAAFLIWVWTDPHAPDINAVIATISAIGAILLNV